MKSNVRTNDELIPRPTDVNLGEKRIKVSIQREHPYQSHIPRCAMFPTFRCPDDPHTGVRATTKLPLNPLLPASAPQVTVLSKSKGAPYRHELLDVPMETMRNVATWPGQNGFKNHTKPVKGQMQVFYPKAPKTLCPNMTLRDWKTTLSERTANMLRNVEKAQWLTSYQLHYTGTGPTNPIKLDDFNEKTISLITGETDPYTAQLKERSYPSFLPPRPLEGRKARILQNRRPLEGRYPPPSPSSTTEPAGWGLVSQQTFGALKTTAKKTPNQDNTPRNQSTPYNVNVEQEVFRAIEANQSSQPNCSSDFNSEGYVCDRCWERNCMCLVKLSEPDTKVRPFPPQNTLQAALKEKNDQRGQSAFRRSKAQKYMDRKNPFELSQLSQSGVEGTDRYMSLEQPAQESEGEEERVKGVSRTSFSIQPRSSSAPFRYGGSVNNRADGNGLFRSQSVLLDLQDSFSQTEAHHRFHEILQGASMDLRDNHHTGRKHSFYGFNSYYFFN
ncbi:sperm-associated microtubule inner protein 4 [Salminus brasiliensis]|uniref:sperm-associated microtubule inner protein 4 n=1 Tax=Salminus brasiliensis TaxID=930266 RepID=UPI003B832AAB